PRTAPAAPRSPGDRPPRGRSPFARAYSTAAPGCGRNPLRRSIAPDRATPHPRTRRTRRGSIRRERDQRKRWTLWVAPRRTPLWAAGERGSLRHAWVRRSEFHQGAYGTARGQAATAAERQELRHEHQLHDTTP